MNTKTVTVFFETERTTNIIQRKDENVNMKTLDTIMTSIDQAESLTNALEDAIINFTETNVENEYNAKKHMFNLLYVLLEQLQKLKADAEDVQGHIEVCNAIYAVNRVDELRAEIERLKNKND